MAYYRAVAQAAASTPERIGVLLANLGTPDSPSYFAVQRYLREFLERSARHQHLARGYGCRFSTASCCRFGRCAACATTARSGCRTARPWRCTRIASTNKIGDRLHAMLGDRVRVALGMTYGNPSIASAVNALAEQNVRRLLVLPLYPQYCSSTTGSVFDRTAQALGRWRWLPEMRFINDYYADAGYIDALARAFEEHWERAGERSHLVFSYHGIPPPT